MSNLDCSCGATCSQVEDLQAEFHQEQQALEYNKLEEALAKIEKLQARSLDQCGEAHEYRMEIERLNASKWIRVGEENNLPKLGKHVLLFSDGVVQEDTYRLDRSSGCFGLNHYWYREELEQNPYVREDDYWQYLPQGASDEWR
jgi:hypothetical protein